MLQMRKSSFAIIQPIFGMHLITKVNNENQQRFI